MAVIVHYIWKHSVRCLVLIEATNGQKPLHHNCLNGVIGWTVHCEMGSLIKWGIGWMGSVAEWVIGEWYQWLNGALAEWGYSAEWDHWSNGALAEWGQWWMVHYAFRCFTPFAFNLFFFCKRTACAKLKAGMTTPIFYPQHWFVPSHEATVTNRMTHSCYEQRLSS